MEKKKINIKRVLLAILWSVLAAGVVVLFVAAIGKKNSEACKGIEIDIKGVGQYYFVDKHDVMDIIAPNDKPVKGKGIASFDLRKLEETIEKNVWVKDAELFFDNKAVLHVKVEEREPMARIFTAGGNSFYIDSSYARLPLSSKMSVKLPVFTGFPAEAIRMKADSALLQHIKQVSLFIAADSFWTAQIEQVDITPFKTFEMVPTVGNHIIQFGDGNNCEAKFHRLMVFYKNILPKVGLNKYAYINVQYDKQVVGMRRGADNIIDSLQALRNIQQMLLAAKQMRNDSSAAMANQLPLNQAPEKLSDSTLSMVDDSAGNTAPAHQAATPAVTVQPKPAAAKPPAKKPPQKRPTANAAQKRH